MELVSVYEYLRSVLWQWSCTLSWVTFLIGSAPAHAQQAFLQTPISELFCLVKIYFLDKLKNWKFWNKRLHVYDQGLFNPVEDFTLWNQIYNTHTFCILVTMWGSRNHCSVTKLSSEGAVCYYVCPQLAQVFFFFSDLSLGISIPRLDICSSTSLRAGMILIKMMLSSGLTEVPCFHWPSWAIFSSCARSL